MVCCDSLAEAIERGAFYHGAKHPIGDGPIVNDPNTDFYIRAPASRGHDCMGISYCPFCGRFR
jgi:hypothetical protein